MGCTFVFSTILLFFCQNRVFDDSRVAAEKAAVFSAGSDVKRNTSVLSETWRCQHDRHELWSTGLLSTAVRRAGVPVCRELILDRASSGSLGLSLRRFAVNGVSRMLCRIWGWSGCRKSFTVTSITSPSYWYSIVPFISVENATKVWRLSRLLRESIREADFDCHPFVVVLFFPHHHPI